MKYAFMSFSCPELNLQEMLSLAKKLGYDAIEPRISAKHGHGIELGITAAKQEKIRRETRSSGIPICCVATSCRFSDPAIAKEQVDETLQCIDLAAGVGSSRLRVFGGEIPKNVSRGEATDVLVESLKCVADHAQQQGVTVCVETHDSWCNPAHLAEVIKRVSHTAIAVNWDIMHPVLSGNSTMDEAFRVLKPWVKHVHFHDCRKDVIPVGSRLVPIGNGIVDHRRALELLKSVSYDGYLSGEWIGWEPYDIHLPRELAKMRQYEQELS